MVRAVAVCMRAYVFFHECMHMLLCNSKSDSDHEMYNDYTWNNFKIEFNFKIAAGYLSFRIAWLFWKLELSIDHSLNVHHNYTCYSPLQVRFTYCNLKILNFKFFTLITKFQIFYFTHLKIFILHNLRLILLPVSHQKWPACSRSV